MAPRKYRLGRRGELIEETRRRIIDATFLLHGEKGILATSVQDIAQRANVALRTVYNHFPTLDDLVMGCGSKVVRVLAPPTAAIFEGLTTLEERLQRLVEEQFAMYGRGSRMLEVARCEQDRVAALAAFMTREAARHEALVRAALRPFSARASLLRTVIAMTDFSVWQAFSTQRLTTAHAVEVVLGGLLTFADAEGLGPGPTERRITKNNPRRRRE